VLQETIADLRRELNEKNGIIKEQHGTMESLRRTIQVCSCASEMLWCCLPR
jgi:hypothetical protein